MSYVDEVIAKVIEKNPGTAGISSGSKRGTGVFEADRGCK